MARVDGASLEVVGIGHQPALGTFRGTSSTWAATPAPSPRRCRRREEMCGEQVRDVIVGVSGGSAASHNQSLEVAIGHHEIGERDVRRVQQHIQLPAETADRDVIHSAAIGYTGGRHAGSRCAACSSERLGSSMSAW